MVNEVLRTVPLGALLAARRADGRGTAWGAALVGFGAGALLEVGQLFVVGRHAEITDALWAATGSAFGFGSGVGAGPWSGVEGGWDESISRSTRRRFRGFCGWPGRARVTCRAPRVDSMESGPVDPDAVT